MTGGPGTGHAEWFVEVGLQGFHQRVMALRPCEHPGETAPAEDLRDVGPRGFWSGV